MFIYVSGISASFYKTEKNSFFTFFMDKVMRIMVPFVFAIFIFLIPRLYMGQEFEFFTRLSDGQVEWDFKTYYIQVIPKLFMKLSWLWFLPVLFVVCCMDYPLIAWSRRRSKKQRLEG